MLQGLGIWVVARACNAVGLQNYDPVLGTLNIRCGNI